MSHQTAGCSDPVFGRISLGLELPFYMGMAETPLQNGQLLQGHLCLQILYLCTMLWIPWVMSAS